MLKTILNCIFLFAIFISNVTYSQTIVKFDIKLICNTWYPEKYQEANGKVYPVPAESKNEYVKYNCNGTMESIEDGGVIINGTWIFNQSTNTITTIQNANKNYPTKVVTTLVKLNEHEMVAKGKDAGGSTITMYFKTK